MLEIILSTAPSHQVKTFTFIMFSKKLTQYLTAKSEWERFKFFWSIGLRPSIQDGDAVEINMECYIFQEVCDELVISRPQRKTKSKAYRLIDKWCKGGL